MVTYCFQLRPAIMNMVRQFDSESHNNPTPTPLCLSHFCIKSRLLWTCAHAQCRIHFFHHVEFYFRFRHLISFPVWGQLYCACLDEESSIIFPVINDAPYIVTCPQFRGWCHLHCWGHFPFWVVFISGRGEVKTFFFCFGGGDNSFCGGVYFFFNFKSECGTARSAQPIILFPCFALV